MSRQALELALDALKDNQHLVADNERHVYVMEYNSIIEKCEEALAQPEQEPVAWITEKISGPTKGYMTVTFNKDTGWKEARSIPLYEQPPQRKPLTVEQIAKELYKFESAGAWYQFARAIEAAHGIKE